MCNCKKNYADEDMAIFIDGKKVTVVLSGGYKGMAVCNPSDEFNFKIGFNIAYQRALIARCEFEIECIIKFCTN